ncbi:MAG: hypothetical protein NZ518_01290 [Dehalococcoidia bacterium]|nr:hypothetical protein [Dehalococcoidia bacterium]
MITDPAILADAIVSGAGRQPFRVTMTEPDVIALVKRLLTSSATLGSAEFTLNITPTLVTIDILVPLMGMPVKVQVTGVPRLHERAVRFDFDGLTLNGAPAPMFIYQLVTSRVNERLGPERFPMELDSLELGDGTVSVSGYTK